MGRSEFEEALYEFMTKEDPSDREFTVMTGLNGMKMINDAMKSHVEEAERQALIATLDVMFSSNLVSKDTQSKLMEMINSPDRENWRLAESLMESPDFFINELRKNL